MSLLLDMKNKGMFLVFFGYPASHFILSRVWFKTVGRFYALLARTFGKLLRQLSGLDIALKYPPRYNFREPSGILL